jgi:hypothetical protein
VVSVPTSLSPAKSVSIRQPSCSFGSVIDLSASDAVQAVASMSPAKPVCIGQPARSYGSVIDLSASDAAEAVAFTASLAKPVSIHQPAPCSSVSVIDLSAPGDAALAVMASALSAKPVFICQPAPRSSGFVIDLSTPNRALALASALPAKPVLGLSSGIVIDISRIDAVKENRVLADQNHVLVIVVEQMKSREQEAAQRCRALEESRDRLYLDYWSQRDVINDLNAWLANNNADLISDSRI